MPDDPITNTPDDGGTPNDVDLSKYVPLEEVEKLKGDNEGSLSSLQKQLDETKLKLVDPDYVEFLAAKKEKETPPVKKATGAPQEIQDVLDAQSTQIRQLQTSLQNVGALLELADVEKRYGDFNNYRDDVQKILETANNNLTIEQAYKMAKADNPPKPGDEPAETPPKGGERPGGRVPAGALEHKDYANEKDAGNAAWDAVKEKHGLTGDII